MQFAHAAGASLFLNNPPKIVEEGSTVIVDVKVNSGGEVINAISGVLSFPQNILSVNSISKGNSLISLWIEEPKVGSGQISFEGVILNPGYAGASGQIFRIIFNAKKTGLVTLNFKEGSILANDGLGSNLLTGFGSTKFTIIAKQTTTTGSYVPPDKPTYVPPADNGLTTIPKKTIVALPVITEYSQASLSSESIFVKGKGEPNALTKIVFRDIATKSLGEKFVASVDNKKLKLEEVLVKNDEQGVFSYISSKNLLAGVYNATPFLVDEETNTEKPGLGVQLLVSDSKVVKALVVVINILGLLIPIVTLCVIVYFIPWYSFRRMRIIKKKLGLEEEKLDITGHQLERQDKAEEFVSNKVQSLTVEEIRHNKPIEKIIEDAIKSTDHSGSVSQ
ncbi:MAG: cohesin domain-containing protein [bacterium]|nr:cohesin domain-containing protein [bacterium]